MVSGVKEGGIIFLDVFMYVADPKTVMENLLSLGEGKKSKCEHQSMSSRLSTLRKNHRDFKDWVKDGLALVEASNNELQNQAEGKKSSIHDRRKKKPGDARGGKRREIREYAWLRDLLFGASSRVEGDRSM